MDFLTDEELAELEAELEAEFASEPEPQAAHKQQSKPEPEPEPEPTPAIDDSAELDKELAQLEAELNVTAPSVSAEVQKASEAAEAVEFAKVAEAESETASEVATEAIDTGESTDEFADEQVSLGVKSKPDAVLIDPDELRRDLAFSDHNIQDAFMTQAGSYAYYAAKAHEAAYRYDTLKNQTEMIYAMLDGEIREAAAEAGEKITEAVVKNRILLNPRYQKALKRELEAKKVAGLAKEACEAFKQRRDMLIQVGTNLREEFKGELRIKAAQAGLDARKEAALNVVRKAQ